MPGLYTVKYIYINNLYNFLIIVIVLVAVNLDLNVSS